MSKKLLLAFLFVGPAAIAQLSADSAIAIIGRYRIGSNTYFQPFERRQGFGAPWILTYDGGAAAFGSNTVYKIGKNGKEQWSKEVTPQFDELETQAVAEDTKGNLFVFMLSYDSKRYRGGSERIICYKKDGTLLWDKTLGSYTVMNNPTISYIRAQGDGRIYLRGHTVTDKPDGDKDPIYRYWQGWLDSTGKLTEKVGEVIDWRKDEWQKIFQPD